jgi:HAE1 family hydrophobic/amphiphilic exporter-1
MGLANDVYAQIAIITLLGLLGKNAVLIVEFAVQKRNEGLSLRDAALEGARMRFRPILMTSFAFVAGLVPLVASHGAGAVGNRTLGSSAMGGMLTGTIIGVFVIPGLYFLFATLVDGKDLLKDEVHTSITESIVGTQKNRRKKHRTLKGRLKLLLKKMKLVVATPVDGKNLLKDEVHTRFTESIVGTQKNRSKKHRTLKGRLKLLMKKMKRKN